MKKIIFLLSCFTLISCKESNDTQDNTNAHTLEKLISNLPSNTAVCEIRSSDINTDALSTARCNWLSDFNLFKTIENTQLHPEINVIPYTLNSTLFTDYSTKDRFIFIPDNQQATISSTHKLTFPLGTTFIKAFSLKGQDGIKVIEIRLAIKRENGWVFLPYIWHEGSQDAFFYREGLKINSSVYDHTGNLISFDYETPSASNCQECHRDEEKNESSVFAPIGPKARHLNKTIQYNGQNINQLTLWQDLGLLTGLPDILNEIDTAPNWLDESENLQDRVKAYLDINCAHCHSDGGSAALSGLRLEYWRKSIGHTHGVCNSSHGWRGGGFDIWPGRGELSSIPIRMRHTSAKDRMPPIGRSLIDEKAADLISQWIDSLPYQDCAP